ncbi:SET domain-containing protein [Kaarinaea lacus]
MSNVSYAAPYYVARSPIHGKGVFASRPIREGEIIGTLNVSPATRNGHHVLWISENQKVRVNCRLRYVNHSEEPNAVYYDTLEVVALRDIDKDEEITHDYSGG